jgi:hypothetical protein
VLDFRPSVPRQIFLAKALGVICVVFSGGEQGVSERFPAYVPVFSFDGADNAIGLYSIVVEPSDTVIC